MKVPWYGWPLLISGACRIGGPSADPRAYIEFPSDAGAAEDGSLSVDSGSDDASVADATVDVTSGSDTGAEGAADAPGSDGGDGGACVRPDAGACDPIANAGCIALQCDIDTRFTTPTGICVLASPLPNAPGTSCTQVSGSVSCQPGYTCYGGTCQKVCFCNADCSSGQCCNGSAGTTGFGLCSACH